ncbi:MAG: DUF3106 domain-containing protein [Acidobacteriaceae bacterium]
MEKTLAFRSTKNRAALRFFAGLLLATATSGVLSAQSATIPTNSSAQPNPTTVENGTVEPAPYRARPQQNAAGPQQTPAPILPSPQSEDQLNAVLGQINAPPPPPAPNQSGGGDHLAQWMKRHKWMTLEQQQQALNQLPGFNLLSPQAQYRLHQRLAQLYAMQPLQRQRTLEHIEAMEQLTPSQQSQVRAALGQLGALPPAQRRQVIQIFRRLRQLPPARQWRAVNAPRFDWMPESERLVLTNLVRISPLLPPE